jgi:hypothetical protein
MELSSLLHAPATLTTMDCEAVGFTPDRHVSENRKIMPASESGTDQAAVRHCSLRAVNFSHYLLMYIYLATIQTFLSPYLQYAVFHCTSTLLLSSCLHTSNLPLSVPLPNASLNPPTSTLPTQTLLSNLPPSQRSNTVEQNCIKWIILEVIKSFHSCHVQENFSQITTLSDL